MSSALTGAPPNKASLSAPSSAKFATPANLYSRPTSDRASSAEIFDDAVILPSPSAPPKANNPVPRAFVMPHESPLPPPTASPVPRCSPTRPPQAIPANTIKPPVIVNAPLTAKAVAHPSRPEPRPHACKTFKLILNALLVAVPPLCLIGTAQPGLPTSRFVPSFLTAHGYPKHLPQEAHLWEQFAIDADALPRAAWARDAIDRVNASMMSIAVPCGSRLEVFAAAGETADASAASAPARLLSFRISKEPVVADFAPLFLPAVALLSWHALWIMLAAAAPFGDPRCVSVQALMALSAAPCAAYLLESATAVQYQEDSMELRPDGVTMLRSWGKYGAVAAHVDAASVSAVGPFSVAVGNAGSMRLADWTGALRHDERKLLAKLIAEHYAAIEADRSAQSTASHASTLHSALQATLVALEEKVASLQVGITTLHETLASIQKSVYEHIGW